MECFEKAPEVYWSFRLKGHDDGLWSWVNCCFNGFELKFWIVPNILLVFWLIWTFWRIPEIHSCTEKMRAPSGFLTVIKGKYVSIHMASAQKLAEIVCLKSKVKSHHANYLVVFKDTQCPAENIREFRPSKGSLFSSASPLIALLPLPWEWMWPLSGKKPVFQYYAVD